MTLRSLIFVLVFGALAAFVLVNWSVLNEPTTLSLAFAEVQAPLGVVMLGFVVVVTLLFLGYIVYLQMSGLLETRRHGKELQTQRALADQAEASPNCAAFSRPSSRARRYARRNSTRRCARPRHARAAGEDRRRTAGQLVVGVRRRTRRPRRSLAPAPSPDPALSRSDQHQRCSTAPEQVAQPFRIGRACRACHQHQFASHPRPGARPWSAARAPTRRAAPAAAADARTCAAPAGSIQQRHAPLGGTTRGS